MKRTLLGCLLLVGLGLLILHQLVRLEELTARRAGLRKEVALAKINVLPAAKAAEAAPPAAPARTERLDELIRHAHRIMGGLPLLHPEDLFSDYPQLETAFLNAAEGRLRMKFGGFFVLAGFSEQQIDRFLEISLAGERDWIALTKEAAARGISPYDPSLKPASQESYHRRKQEMEALLGPAGIALREKYSEEQPAREALMSLTKATALGDHPLTLDQLNRLAALTTEAGVFDDDRPLQAVSVLSGASGKAAEILTPEQQPLFDLLVNARQANLLKALDRKKAH